MPCDINFLEDHCFRTTAGHFLSLGSLLNLLKPVQLSLRVVCVQLLCTFLCRSEVPFQKEQIVRTQGVEPARTLRDPRFSLWDNSESLLKLHLELLYKC